MLRTFICTTFFALPVLASTGDLEKEISKDTTSLTTLVKEFPIDKDRIEKREFIQVGVPYLGVALKVYPKRFNENYKMSGPNLFECADDAAVNILRRFVGGDVATVESFITFTGAVNVGDMLEFYTTILETGTTSIKCVVDGYARRALLNEGAELIPVVRAAFTFVKYKNDKASSLPLNKQNIKRTVASKL